MQNLAMKLAILCFDENVHQNQQNLLIPPTFIPAYISASLN